MMSCRPSGRRRNGRIVQKMYCIYIWKTKMKFVIQIVDLHACAFCARFDSSEIEIHADDNIPSRWLGVRRLNQMWTNGLMEKESNLNWCGHLIEKLYYKFVCDETSYFWFFIHRNWMSWIHCCESRDYYSFMHVSKWNLCARNERRRKIWFFFGFSFWKQRILRMSVERAHGIDIIS